MKAPVECGLNEGPIHGHEKALASFLGERGGELTFVWLGAGAAPGGYTYLRPVTGGGRERGIESNPQRPWRRDGQHNRRPHRGPSDQPPPRLLSHTCPGRPWAGWGHPRSPSAKDTDPPAAPIHTGMQVRDALTWRVCVSPVDSDTDASGSRPQTHRQSRGGRHADPLHAEFPTERSAL